MLSATHLYINIQVNLIITLSLGSMETDYVITEPCSNEVFPIEFLNIYRGYSSFWSEYEFYFIE